MQQSTHEPATQSGDFASDTGDVLQWIPHAIERDDAWRQTLLRSVADLESVTAEQACMAVSINAYAGCPLSAEVQRNLFARIGRAAHALGIKHIAIALDAVARNVHNKGCYRFASISVNPLLSRSDDTNPFQALATSATELLLDVPHDQGYAQLAVAIICGVCAPACQDGISERLVVCHSLALHRAMGCHYPELTARTSVEPVLKAMRALAAAEPYVQWNHGAWWLPQLLRHVGKTKLQESALAANIAAVHSLRVEVPPDVYSLVLGACVAPGQAEGQSAMVCEAIISALTLPTALTPPSKHVRPAVERILQSKGSLGEVLALKALRAFAYLHARSPELASADEALQVLPCLTDCRPDNLAPQVLNQVLVFPLLGVQPLKNVECRIDGAILEQWTEWRSSC